MPIRPTCPVTIPGSSPAKGKKAGLSVPGQLTGGGSLLEWGTQESSCTRNRNNYRVNSNRYLSIILRVGHGFTEFCKSPL